MRTFLGQRQRLTALLGIVLVALMVVGLAPGRVYAGGNLGPRAMLTEYYNLINQRDYATAYAQWTNPPQTYADFVAGYADTSYITAYFGGMQARVSGAQSGSVPAVLVGYHYDSTQAAYYGCYDVAYDPTSSGMGLWRITGAQVVPLNYMPTFDQIQVLLRGFCDPNGPISPTASYPRVQQVLVDYYIHINAGELWTAYQFWTTPYQTYQTFADGWADTTETVMFFGEYQWIGTFGGAEAGRVPVVLLGYHTDGSLVSFQGCVRLNFDASTPRGWGILGASLSSLWFDFTPDAVSINNALYAPCY